MSVIVVTDDTFEKEVLQSDLPVLVKWWAPWCGPCKAVAPIVEELSKELEGKLKAVQVNTDENPKTSMAWTIRGIPSMYLFVKGKTVETVIGAVPKAMLLKAVEKHLA